MSYIIQFIKDNPNDYKEKLSNEPFCITIKQDGDLCIFNYNQTQSDMYNPIVQEARGIIINVKTLEVVCYPFRKFGNYGEGYVDKIDWSTARVQEKVDGSIVKLWYNKINECWQWSTNGMIQADDKFMDLIKQTRTPNTDTLDRGYTYIFELISPFNQIVVKYTHTELIHLGTRNNTTGKECELDLGFKKPKEYKASTLAECIELANTLNSDGDIKEGFVIVDNNYNRIKVKTPEYIKIHYIRGNVVTTKDLIDVIMLNEIDEFLTYRSEYKDMLYALKDKYDSLVATIYKNCEYYKNTYDGDRKKLALAIKDNKYSHFIFDYIFHDKIDINSKNVLTYLK